jgi:hypothetical protein
MGTVPPTIGRGRELAPAGRGAHGPGSLKNGVAAGALPSPVEPPCGIELRFPTDCRGRPMETWKHLRAILLLPGMVLLIISETILRRSEFDTRGL